MAEEEKWPLYDGYCNIYNNEGNYFMKKLIILCLNFCLCLVILTGCGASKEVKKLTAEDIQTFSSQLNTDPLSGDIMLNGIKYSLPVKAKSLEDNGFKYNDYADKGQALKNGYYVDSIKMDDGSKSEESRISVTIFNTSGSEMKFEDAMIGGIEIDKRNDSYKNTIHKNRLKPLFNVNIVVKFRRNNG